MTSRHIFSSSTQNLLTQEKHDKIQCFKEILRKSGVILMFNEEPNILNQEQALVVRDIEKNLEDSSESEHTDEFIKGLKTLCGKQKYFRKALLHTHFKTEDTEDTDFKVQQESIIRILLKVKCLQKTVIDIILEDIATTVGEESEDTSWLRMLLCPLRFLPQIQDPEYLTTRLLDILDISTYASQLEILDSLPEILPDSQYPEATKQLCKLLNDNDELSGAIIDCLNALNLDTEVRLAVQETILVKISSGTSIKIFPILLEFLLTECKSSNLVQTLLKVRNALDALMLEKCDDHETSKILIFSKLQIFSTAPKIISEAWLNMLSGIKSHTDHKPIDFLILLMLHSSTKMKKRIIEVIFRKRIKDGLFKAALIEKMFEKYITKQLYRDYFQSMIDIGCSLLRVSTKEHLIVNFACTLFKGLFKYEQAEIIYRQEILDSLILLTGANDQKDARSVLGIFLDFLDDITKLQQHTLLLMRLLEKLDSFEMTDVKIVFEILCTLTCGKYADEAASAFKDEIHMIVRKQLSSSKRSIKHRGIISAVVMAKHIATVTDEQSETSIEDESLSISSLPQGSAKEAACLLELADTCTSSCPELMVLYYDELVSMISMKNDLNKYLLAWLKDTITANVHSFVTEVEPNCEFILNDLRCFSQFSLNSDTEMTTPVVINIAELTIKPQNHESNSILILSPQFRLLRQLHLKCQNGDLSDIDVLLGCPVILPDLSDIEMLDSELIEQTADCVFHCINWFREVLSGFVTQKSKHLRNKVVNRIKDILELEIILKTCLENVPNHKLPVGYIDLSQTGKQAVSVKETKSKKPPKKKMKSAETVHDDTIASTSAAATSAVKTKAKKKSLSHPEHNIKFREMDADVLILLKYPLKLEGNMPTQTQSISTTQYTTLNINQLQFLLNEFIDKLKTFQESKNTDLSHLNVITSKHLIEECVLILPNVSKHLDVIREKLRKLLEEADGIYDAPVMFTNEVRNLKICFGSILESFSLIFSWSGFHHSKNLDLLRKILQALRKISQSQLTSVSGSITDFIIKLSTYIDQCFYMNHAISIVKTVQYLYDLLASPNTDLQNKIIVVCGNILKRKWHNSKGLIETGKQFLENVDLLFKIYFGSASVKTLYGIVGTLQIQAVNLKSKNDTLIMFAIIDKSNFYILYRNIYNALQNQVKVEIQSLTNKEHLILWRTIALTMQGLMSIAKAQQAKTNLVCFLKKSIGILKIFLSHGIPILEIILRNKPDEVVEIFKIMQTSTRFLHHLCCYSKLNKDSSLMAYVPQFRLVLETLVYRVKAALVANNCSAAFWMGNLRNRDLQGDDILSQSTISETTNPEGSEDELPDDESDQDILNDSNENDANGSGSDVYD